VYEMYQLNIQSVTAAQMHDSQSVCRAYLLLHAIQMVLNGLPLALPPAHAATTHRAKRIRQHRRERSAEIPEVRRSFPAS